MLDFLIILFFAKTVLLTPNFIDIDVSNEPYKLNFAKPVTAINSGAEIQIDVTEMLSADIDKGVIVVRTKVKELFPSGSIEVFVLGKGNNINLEYSGVLKSKNSVRLAFTSNQMPTDTEFNSLTLKTKVNLKRVKLFWKNHRK
jgi:hypothetical protein